MEEWINDWGYPDYTPEILQIARYHVGHFYKWHTDGSGRGYRKLSLTSLLNPPSEYEGGEFEFRMPNRIAGDLVMEGQKTVMKLKEKDILLFTPELEHQVLPVLGGQRDSLVIWFIEKP
jgi:predicted 2-oxoglutarate/Fe(II)-dependent dioxygenase YbiX